MRFVPALAIAAAAGLAAPALAFTNPAGYKADWQYCEAEIKKFKCEVAMAKSEEDLYQCLLKHDEDLSKGCDNNSHSKYEAATGKTKTKRSFTSVYHGANNELLITNYKCT